MVFASTCVAAAEALRRRRPDLFTLDFMPRWVLIAAGILLVASGLALWISGVVTVQRAYNSDRLCTTGACGVCRHPIYASWAVLVAPGSGLLLNCWAFILAAACMCVFLSAVVHKEEVYLEGRFGEVYRIYKRRVPAILPLGWFKRG